MPFMARLNEARVAAQKPRDEDPWEPAIRRVLPFGVTSISTVSICDLLDVPPTTANGRRVAACMRALGFVPLKSRRLEPGGRYGNTIRGWAKPIREPDC